MFLVIDCTIFLYTTTKCLKYSQFSIMKWMHAGEGRGFYETVKYILPLVAQWLNTSPTIPRTLLYFTIQNPVDLIVYPWL